jgi:hypothetical protein
MGEERVRRCGEVEVALLVWACVAVPGALCAQSGFQYHFFLEPRPLRLDPTRIALFSTTPSPGAESLQTRLEQRGLAVDGISPLMVLGWDVVTLAGEPGEGGATAVITNIADLARDPSFEFVSPVFIGENGGTVIVTRDILVRFEAEEVDPGAAERILAESQAGDIIDRLWGGMEGAYRLRSRHSNGLDVLEDANRLALLPGVRFAEPNMIFTGGGALIPNDTGFSNCWGLHNTGQFSGLPDFDMDAPEAWDVTIGDSNVIVVVIDVGVQQDHPDIHQIPGNDVTSDPSTTGGPVNSFDRHGTAVAGSITATINNGLGTVGVAPGCVSASARTFIATDASGNWITEIEWTVESLAWAETIGARVTNNSNFYGFQSSAIAEKYQQTRDAGMVHFASAGNLSNPWIEYPASLPSVISAAAVKNTGTFSTFSSFGPDLDFVAPGEDVYTTDRTGADGYTLGSFIFLNGTSFSSSYAAGVAAMFLSSHPGAKADVVEEALRLTAVDLGDPGRDDRFGWGLVNAADAVTWNPGCETTPAPLPEPNGVVKNRYLSFVPGIIGRQAALRVTLLNLPSPFESLVGESFWVGDAVEAVDSVMPLSYFTVAKLGCAPVFRDWGDINLLSVTGPAIVPGGVYGVQAVYEACDSAEEAHYSVPLIMDTARWGDIVPPFNPPDPRTQPDFVDIAGVVDRFKSAIGAPGTALADLEPAEPNQIVDFSDISNDVDAFKGSSYPFPAACPCGLPCF